MSISMYKASAPVFLRMLGNLDALLEKAVENAKQRGFDPNVLVTQRLAPDMLPLSAQVQFASDTAKFAMSRLSGGTDGNDRRGDSRGQDRRDASSRSSGGGNGSGRSYGNRGNGSSSRSDRGSNDQDRRRDNRRPDDGFDDIPY